VEERKEKKRSFFKNHTLSEISSWRISNEKDRNFEE